MIRTLLAGSAAAALLVTAAAAGPGTSGTATDTAWQMAQAQPTPETQPPAAGQPAPDAGQPGATGQQPPPVGQTAQEPVTDQPADTAQEPTATDQPAETAEEPAADGAPGEAEQAATPMDQQVFITEQEEAQWLASDYIGQTVYNQQDEDIGSINDLIIDEAGGLVGVVVGVGGFLGIGEKEVGISMDVVEVQQEENEPKLVVEGSREALLEAPDFIDKETQQAEAERQQREAQQPAGGMPAGGMGGAPAGGPQQ